MQKNINLVTKHNTIPKKVTNITDYTSMICSNCGQFIVGIAVMSPTLKKKRRNLCLVCAKRFFTYPDLKQAAEYSNLSQWIQMQIFNYMDGTDKRDSVDLADRIIKEVLKYEKRT